MTVEGLQRLSHVLLWVAITGPIVSAIAVGARYYVERREKALVAEQSRKGAAELRVDLQAARAEVERLKREAAPRRLTATQSKHLRDRLALGPPAKVLVACRTLDGEGSDFADDLAESLRSAGWTVQVNKTLLTNRFGLSVANGGRGRAAGWDELSDALNAIGIAHEKEVIPDEEPGLYLYVLRKQGT